MLIGYFLAGLALGAAVAVPFVLLVMRGRLSKELSAASATADQLKVEITTCQTRLKESEEQARIRAQEWNEERTALHSERSRLIDARLAAAEGQARSEESARAAMAVAQTVTGERDELAKSLGQIRSESEALKVELATQRSRAEEAERSKEATLVDKQAACDQLIEAERVAQAQARQALLDSSNATEEALRQGYEKEIAAKDTLLTEVQEYMKKADETLREVFGDASTKALQRASESFFEIAKKRFDERDETAKSNAEAHKKDLEKLLQPVKEELGELEKLNREIEKERAESFGSLKEQLQNLNKSSESLANALKKPSVRGSWGEGQLLSILESSGWVQGKNFDVQDVTDDDGVSLRTDVVIHLPRGRKIIIDSKAPLDQYMAATEAENEEERVRRCTEHARAVRGHVKALEKKEYWSRYAESPPYVILFMPYEAAYQIACEYDRALLDEAHRSRIILANPMTLMNLVHLATFVLNEERLQQNAEEVRLHAKQLCERLGKVLDLMGDHGRHVRIAAESYNKLVASVSSRLIPASNRMRELGAGAEKPLSVPDSVDTAIRHLVVPELTSVALVGAGPSDLDLEAEETSLFLTNGAGSE